MNTVIAAITRYEYAHEALKKRGIPIKPEILRDFLDAQRALLYARTGYNYVTVLEIGRQPAQGLLDFDAVYPHEPVIRVAGAKFRKEVL